MFLCLFLPTFSLQSVLRWRNNKNPAVIVDDNPSACVILEANKKALDSGITIGMTPAQAMARAIDVLILPRSPAQEHCTNQLLLDIAFRLTPKVELTTSGICIADLRNARTYCWQQLADEQINRLQKYNLYGQIGIASTPDLAYLAARTATQVSIIYDSNAFVNSLPVEALNPSVELLQILNDWGIQQISDLIALPRVETIERLGIEAKELLQKISACHKRPLIHKCLAPKYTAAFDFEYEVETIDPLLLLLRRFLFELCERLHSAHRVAHTAQLIILLVDGSNYKRIFHIPAPTAEVDVLFRIIHTHLETLQLPHRITGIRLNIESTLPIKEQLQLFEGALRDPNRFGETLAKLKSILGNDNVGIPRKLNTHRPGCFTLDGLLENTQCTTQNTERTEIGDNTKSSHNRLKALPVTPIGLPLRRYRPPIIAAISTATSGQPIFIRSAITHGTICRFAGPYRLSGNWWDIEHWSTEEWDIELKNGELYRLARRGKKWTIEGAYNCELRIADCGFREIHTSRSFLPEPTPTKIGKAPALPSPVLPPTSHFKSIRNPQSAIRNYYIELHARSAFSFLYGASHPEQLAETAARLNIPALALCDRDGVYGAPRLYAACREQGIRPIVGAELTIEGEYILPVIVTNRIGYSNLCRLITEAKLRGTKKAYSIQWNELAQYSEGLIALTGDQDGVFRNLKNPGALNTFNRLMDAFGKKNVFIELQRHLHRGEKSHIKELISIAHSNHIPIVATNGVCYAEPKGRRILDIFTCIKNHTHLDAAGRLLSLNDERYLKTAKQMQLLFADIPEAIENTIRIADRIDFTLENLGYEFPKYPVPEGESMDSFLRKVTFAGARARYSHLSKKVLKQLNFELDLIHRLGFSGYFLIVWDIANYCSENNILMQGRGSAANSAVCYSLGITACDPISCNLLFERFLSEGRTSWPDIDLDLPSGRQREQVIQEIYHRYGKHGAAMTANVITYRGRSAMREIGKALNFSPDIINRFSSLYASGDFPHTLDLSSHLKQAGMPPSHPRAQIAAQLYQQLYGLPRHLGQHSGGMIICQGALSSIVPLENASMPGRVVAQWDKDDCEDLGIIKVDLLGLGMMAVMQDTLELCQRRSHPVDLASIPKDDPAVYQLLTRADTVGTFQVESRAQMATLPRMKPKCFYDVVVEVAIIRPGPIQGGMMNPYLARRDGLEPITYFDERLRPILERTLGVPLFQEQLLKIAMVMANFSGSEAEELRRALSFHRSQERMKKVCVKLRQGMIENHVAPDVIEQIVQAIQSFAVYGFPESHAISFALIAYASCWMKIHRAPEFYCSLLSNQPMGFYSSATLIHDAKAHGVKIRPISVLYSEWNCFIEEDGSIRLGLCMVKGMNSISGKRIIEERTRSPFASLQDFRNRIALTQPVLRTLARIGALNGLVKHRRDGLWKIEKRELTQSLPINAVESIAPLQPMDAFERLEADFAGTGITTGKHPMALIRSQLSHVTYASNLPQLKSGTFVCIAGLVICRQRPGTAKGNLFISLEDETGVSNAIVSASLFEQRRLTITQEPFLIIRGIIQNSRSTTIVQARHVDALNYSKCSTPPSHDFH